MPAPPVLYAAYVCTHKRPVPAATRPVPAASSNTVCALCLQQGPLTVPTGLSISRRLLRGSCTNAHFSPRSASGKGCGGIDSSSDNSSNHTTLRLPGSTAVPRRPHTDSPPCSNPLQLTPNELNGPCCPHPNKSQSRAALLPLTSGAPSSMLSSNPLLPANTHQSVHTHNHNACCLLTSGAPSSMLNMLVARHTQYIHNATPIVYTQCCAMPRHSSCPHLWCAQFNVEHAGRLVAVARV
jgi:hypothetical protein